MIKRILPFAACFVISISDLQAAESPGFVTETSKHYSLTFEGSREAARSHLDVLEAAWPWQKEFFRAEPKLDANEKLNVYIANSQNTYANKLEEMGLDRPSPKSGGYYCPISKTAYLFRQDTIFYTRQLMIHECLHQFHFLACTNNQNPKAIWFIEGLAEYFPRHFWDGKNFTPRVVPTLSLEDYYAEALKQVSNSSFDLKKLIEGEADGDRPQWMAIIGWLFERKTKEFYEISRRLNAGEEPKGFTVEYFGDPNEATKEIILWLEAKQEPWTPVFNEWEPLAANRFRGHAPGVVSACRTKAHADELSAVMELPAEGQWQGGLLLEFIDKVNYMILKIDPAGLVAVQRFGNGRWQNINSMEIKIPKGKMKISVKRKGRHIDVSMGNDVMKKIEAKPGPLGFVIDSCSLTFSDIKWKPTSMN